MLQDLIDIRSLLKKVILAILFIAIVLMINVSLLNITLAQVKKSDSEGWVEGHVTALGKNSISVDGIKYQFDPFITVTDPDGNTLEPVALRGAEIVKVQERNGKAMKIVVILFRK